jgi:hypothetical protein
MAIILWSKSMSSRGLWFQPDRSLALTSILTLHQLNGAVHALHCVRVWAGRAMDQIVQTVIESAGSEVGPFTYLKLSDYMSLMASVGKTNDELVVLGKAYLAQFQNPDRRYSGC